MSELIEITHCEVCNNKSLEPAINLGLHPMCDDLVGVGDSRICKEYPIDIVYCKKCNTAHQKYQIPKHELFPRSYHYRSRFTADVLNGMRTLVADCKKLFRLATGRKVLDIGCNDGSLLDFFKEEGAITFGIEPTDSAIDATAKGHAVIQDYLTVKIAKDFVSKNGTVDLITFTNVFAHIEDLDGVLQALKVLFHSNTVLVIENHYLGAVIEKNQFDTFYHEHPRTYSCNSFIYIAANLGLDILSVEFPSRYGGNIRVIMGNRTQIKSEFNSLDFIEKENHFFDGLIKMSGFVEDWKMSMRTRLEELSRIHGPLIAKAFPGRAAILVKLLDLDTDIIKVVYEKPGSMKIGHYIPGTRIPIKSDDELFAIIQRAPVIINLAWHIKDEIKKYLTSNGFKGELVNII